MESLLEIQQTDEGFFGFFAKPLDLLFRKDGSYGEFLPIIVFISRWKYTCCSIIADIWRIASYLSEPLQGRENPCDKQTVGPCYMLNHRIRE